MGAPERSESLDPARRQRPRLIEAGHRLGCLLLLCLASVAVLAPSAGAASSGAVDRLQATECPGQYRNIHRADFYAPDRIDDARRWKFEILDRSITLKPPVNWNQDPYNSRSWLARLHYWQWIDVLLYDYFENGQRESLKKARDLALDWIRSNPEEKGIRWADKVTGDRTGFLSFVTRSAGCEGLLTDSQASRLLDGAKEHGSYLADDGNYSFSNHGLFMDAGLILLGDYLSFFGPTQRWQDHAWDRVKDSFQRSVQWEEGVHLEHSPAYHYKVYGLLDQLLDLAREPDAGLAGLRDRMREVGGWFAMPDGATQQFGDTALENAPEWAREAGAGLRGMSQTRKSGYAIVKDGANDYFAVTAGHHSPAHKQADELSFDLYQQGERVLLDTGRFGFERDKNDPAKVAARQYTLASRAHSTLVVDGQNFRLPQRSFYGSGILATGSGDGWYAVQGENPLVKSQGVSHRRVLLYKPGTAVIVVDDVRSGERHKYTRYFQFAPQVQVQGQGRTLTLQGARFRGAVSDTATSADRARKLVRGQADPMLGWYTAGGWQGFQKRTAAVFVSSAKNVQHATAFALDGTTPLEATIAETSPGSTTVRLTRSGAPVSEVTATVQGNQITIDESPVTGSP